MAYLAPRVTGDGILIPFRPQPRVPRPPSLLVLAAPAAVVHHDVQHRLYIALLEGVEEIPELRLVAVRRVQFVQVLREIAWTRAQAQARRGCQGWHEDLDTVTVPSLIGAGHHSNALQAAQEACQDTGCSKASITIDIPLLIPSRVELNL